MAELTLNHPKRVRDPRADAGLELLDLEPMGRGRGGAARLLEGGGGHRGQEHVHVLGRAQPRRLVQVAGLKKRGHVTKIRRTQTHPAPGRRATLTTSFYHRVIDQR